MLVRSAAASSSSRCTFMEVFAKRRRRCFITPFLFLVLLTSIANTTAAKMNKNKMVVIDERNTSESCIDTTFASGWVIKGVDDRNYSNAYITELSFYIDKDCDKEVDLSNAIFISSSGTNIAKYAFDKSNVTNWPLFSDDCEDSPLIEDNAGLRLKSFYIGYWHGNGFNSKATQDVKCVEIFFDTDQSNDIHGSDVPDRLKLDVFAPSQCAAGRDLQWGDAYFIGGLDNGMNRVKLNSFCDPSGSCNSGSCGSSFWKNDFCDAGLDTFNCDYDGGDCGMDKNEEKNEGRDYWDRISGGGSNIAAIGVTFVISVLFVICLCCMLPCMCCYMCFYRRNRSILENNAERASNESIVSVSSASVPTLLGDKARESRRLYVLSNIIHKKFLLDRNLDSFEEETNIILPHEKGMHSALHNEEMQNEKCEEIAKAPAKDDIFVDDNNRFCNDRSVDDLSRDDPVEDGRQLSSSSHNFPETCLICCDDYKVADDIAWSNNKDCHHSYHVDCIVEWLLGHDDCPQCRAKYLLST